MAAWSAKPRSRPASRSARPSTSGAGHTRPSPCRSSRTSVAPSDSTRGVNAARARGARLRRAADGACRAPYIVPSFRGSPAARRRCRASAWRPRLTSAVSPRSSRPGTGRARPRAPAPRSASETPRRAVGDVRVGDQQQRARLRLDEPLQADPGRARQPLQRRRGRSPPRSTTTSSNSPEPRRVPTRRDRGQQRPRSRARGCAAQPQQASEVDAGVARRARVEPVAGDRPRPPARPPASRARPWRGRCRSAPRTRGRGSRRRGRAAGRRRGARRGRRRRWPAAVPRRSSPRSGRPVRREPLRLEEVFEGDLEGGRHSLFFRHHCPRPGACQGPMLACPCSTRPEGDRGRPRVVIPLLTVTTVAEIRCVRSGGRSRAGASKRTSAHGALARAPAIRRATGPLMRGLYAAARGRPIIRHRG